MSIRNRTKFGPIERRDFVAPDGVIQVRSNADGTIGVRGYAAVFGQEAHGEVIMPGAFDRTLGLLPERSQADEVYLCRDHDFSTIIARTGNGSLHLQVDDRGLMFDAPSLNPNDMDVQQLVTKMNDGLVYQCSFAGYFVEAPINSRGIREVRQVQLVDVSIVTNPWYSETFAQVTSNGGRSADELALALRALSPEQRNELLAAVEDRDDDAPTEVETVAEEAPLDDAPTADEPATEPEPARSYPIADARVLLGL